MTDAHPSHQTLDSNDTSPPPPPPPTDAAAVQAETAHIDPNAVSRASLVDGEMEDGPLFRATVTELESRTSALKANVKKILKAASQSFDAKRKALEADEAFVEALRQVPATDPLLSHYLNDTWPRMHEERERLGHSMQSLLLDPLQQLYEKDIKVAETKRRHFEDVSNEYYAQLAKFLSIKADAISKQKESEAKHLAKRRQFDLTRFDYHAFLTDLNGGKKHQEIMYHLLSYQQKEFAFYQSIASEIAPYKHGLDTLANLMADLSREQNMVHKERFEKRRQLASRYGHSDDAPTGAAEPGIHANDEAIQTPALPLPSTEVDDKFRGIRDLEHQDRDLMFESGRRKEGFLFATAKPLKNNAFDKASGAVWHK